MLQPENAKASACQRLHEFLWPKDAVLLSTCHARWIGDNRIFLALRCAIAVYMGWLFIITNFAYWKDSDTNEDGTKDYNGSSLPFSLQYLTDWGVVMTALFYFFASFDHLAFVLNKYQYYFKNLWRVTHVLFEIAFSFELLIVIMYWGTMAGEPTFTNLSEHGFCLLVLYIDFAFNMIVFVKSHLCICIVLGVCYVIDNVLVTTLYRPVYSVLNYKDVFSYIFVVASIVLLLVHFFFGYWITKKYKAPALLAGRVQHYVNDGADALSRTELIRSNKDAQKSTHDSLENCQKA